MKFFLLTFIFQIFFNASFGYQMFQTSLASHLNSAINKRLNSYFKLGKNPKGRLYKIRSREQRRLGKVVKAKYELPKNFTFTKNGEKNEYQFQAQVYPNQKFEDIEFVEQILKDFIEIAESNVIGKLQAQLVLNSNNLSYTIYAQINRVRKNYFEHENELKKKIYETRNILTFCKSNFEKNRNQVLEQFLDKNDIVIDQYNMHLFDQMIQNIDQKISLIYQSVFNQFDVFFEDLLITHLDLETDDQDKILKLMKLSANLIAFYKDQVKTQIEQLIQMVKLLQTSPKYEHVKIYDLQNKLQIANEMLGKNQEKEKIENIEKEIEEAEEKEQEKNGEDSNNNDKQQSQVNSKEQNESRRLKGIFIMRSILMISLVIQLFQLIKNIYYKIIQKNKIFKLALNQL